MTLWLDTPVLWHTSHVPSGYDYEAMTAEQRALIRERFHDWYTADWDYALTTVYFFCAAIGLAAVLRWGSWFSHRKSGQSVSKTAGVVDRITALCGFTLSKQYRIAVVNWNSPPLAAVGAVTGLFIFTMALMLAAQPYYWPNDAMGHSPPIATRSGWISIAIMPFMIAFAAKVNFIGILTHTSHERLQVFHRWSATIMYITSLVHTFPFIINEIRLGMMVSSWNTSSAYWTGVAALVPQTYLIACSWGYFRNSFYETFKKLHYTAATIFMVALFLHCDFTLTSWDYFWATLGIWGTAWLFRFMRALITPGMATIEALPDRTLRVRVVSGRRGFSWAPGQHVFVRFALSPLHAATTHPFTIANVRGEKAELELVMRVRDGITRALAEKRGKTVRVWVDGPYGHAGLARELQRYDRVLFLAGGSGATFTIPLFLDLVASKPDAKAEFVVAVREGGALTWLERELKPVEGLESRDLVIRTHITREKTEGGDIEKGVVDASTLREGRPNLAELVRNVCAAPGRVAVVACGPEEFSYDVRAAVASEQLRVAQGKSAAIEIYLHAENYSW